MVNISRFLGYSFLKGLLVKKIHFPAKAYCCQIYRGKLETHKTLKCLTVMEQDVSQFFTFRFLKNPYW